MEDQLLAMEGLDGLIESIAMEEETPDYNKIDYNNDSLSVIKAKQAAQARAKQAAENERRKSEAQQRSQIQTSTQHTVDTTRR